MVEDKKIKIPRSLTIRNLYDKKKFRKIQVANEALATVIGNAEARGVWVISGVEKNGKTWFALQLAKAISAYEKVNYISAEENTEDSFVEAVQRAGIKVGDKILADEYMPFDMIIEKFSRRKTSNVIFIDNLTEYKDDLKTMSVRQLSKALPDKLIICLAHEEKNEPHPAAAKAAQKFAKMYFQVKGLTVNVTSRFAGGGGKLAIDPDKSELFWGVDENIETI